MMESMIKEFFILLGITLFMGRKAIGELPILDFLILMSFGAVVGADIADPTINHIHTGIAIILISLLQKVVANLITFDPVVIIKDGVIIEKNIKKIKYSVDNILLKYI